MLGLCLSIDETSWLLVSSVLKQVRLLWSFPVAPFLPSASYPCNSGSEYVSCLLMVPLDDPHFLLLLQNPTLRSGLLGKLHLPTIILRSSDKSCWSHPCHNVFRKAFIDLCIQFIVPSVVCPLSHTLVIILWCLFVNYLLKKKKHSAKLQEVCVRAGYAVHFIPILRISDKGKPLLSEWMNKSPDGGRDGGRSGGQEGGMISRCSWHFSEETFIVNY